MRNIRVWGRTKEKSKYNKKKKEKEKENTHTKRVLGSARPYKSQPKSISKTAPNVQASDRPARIQRSNNFIPQKIIDVA